MSLEKFTTEPPVESLPDAQVIALCDLQLFESQQNELDDLFYDQREGHLTDQSRKRLDELMELYRHSLVRKAQALQVAVARGLRPPLN